MALPIRDGNQTLTTLSTIIVNSAHVPAHSVVSLGSQAITDIATAVSGVELGPNTISALENISVTFGAGTSVTIGNVVSVTGGLTDAELRASSVTIGGSVTANLDVNNLVGQPNTFLSDDNGNVPSLAVNIGFQNSNGDFSNVKTSQGLPVSGSVTANSGDSIIEPREDYGSTTNKVAVQLYNTQGNPIGGQNGDSLPVSGTITIGNSITISSLPSITGSVSVSNLPATQAVTFTQASVTFGQAVVSASNIGDLLSSVATDNTLDTTTKFIKIGGHQSGSNQTSNIVHVSNGGAMSVDASGSSVTFTQASVTFNSITGSVSVLNFPATQTTTFSAITGSVSVLNLPATQTVTFTQASVTFGTPVVTGSVSVLNFPSTQTIAGTVTANGGDGTFLVGGLRGGNKTAFPMDAGTGYLQTKVESMPAISGTVSANATIGVVSQGCFGTVIQGYDTLTGISFGNCVPVKLFEDATGLIGNVAGTVTANVFGKDNTGTPQQLKTDSTGILTVSASGSVQCIDEEGLIFGSDRNFPISGTVTVGAMPNGALTTRFGSVVTANLAQITNAVTNTSRKYLLAQNISAGTVTIGIGFSPTTTQGIQLTAGGGLTFDAFCPTGAVYWLGSVTGAAFTILEG